LVEVKALTGERGNGITDDDSRRDSTALSE
jgi:hypothetical protein